MNDIQTPLQATREWADMLKAQGSPVDTKEALMFWEALSHYLSPISSQEACKLYVRAGYEPFEGFPLKRKCIR